MVTATTTTHRQVLPDGYRLMWYRIERVLGRGSFGITYLATDTNLHRQVAIKEYLPVAFAVREGDSSVHAVSFDRNELYGWGLKRFVAEARTLAKFSHPNIVRVHNIFEDNNTAYMAMEYEHGESLDRLLRRREIGGEADLLRILFPLLDGLDHIHAAGYIHRDIKPGNIFVRADGSPVLLDFGSTRAAMGPHARTLTSLVTHGFAPYEQYDSGEGKQGPWTDIYALSATLYVAVSGSPPTDAIGRINARVEGAADPLKLATDIGKDAFSPRFLRAVDAALKLLPTERPPNVAAWRPMFPGSGEDPAPSVSALDDGGTDRVIDFASLEVDTDVGAAPPSGSPPSGEPSAPRADSARPIRAEPRPRRRRTGRRPALVTVLLIIAVALVFVGRNQIVPREEEARAMKEMLRSTKGASRPSAAPQDTSPPDEASPGVTDGLQDTLADGTAGPEMVIVPAGSFKMGDLRGEGSGYERPVHEVRFGQAFAMGRYEVTFEQYDAFAKATGRGPPSDKGWGRGKRPVINITWDDANSYAEWLSEQTGERYRLPSESEWEYAARAGTVTAYWWGNEIGRERANCDGCGSQWDRKQTAPVGSFEPNQLGLHDTAGNVWEWVQDCNTSYSATPTDGSAWLPADCPERVFRGGAWNVAPAKVRSANRTWDGPNLRYSYVGFRLARDL